ncbi:MAG: phospholipase D-like domain-containing protein, partial [Candidatus Omnitrophica bacterium]|nr:phospholipase D-like domain-containing protein [Candidatus Omnitrophota bacterium]
WVNTTKTNLFNPSYFPKPEQTYGFLPVQITTSGPDSQWDTIRQLYFSLISSAERSIFIRTPYFIPDQSIFTALETAALSGLDVKIILAGKPDKKLPFWAAKTYFQRLLQSGVKLYYYQKGFMHSKAVVVDDYVSSIGSANMDIRSFRLNYEVNTLIYDKNISGQVSKSFIDDLAECKEFSLSECERTKLLFRFRNSLARLFAPLL